MQHFLQAANSLIARLYTAARGGAFTPRMPHAIYQGVPRTSEEWAALAKVASGQLTLTREELRGLFMLGLVDRQLGRVCLNPHGRAALGLDDEYH